MHHPERCIPDRHTLDENVFAAIRLDECGSQDATRAVHALRDRPALVLLFEESVSIGALAPRFLLSLSIPPLRFVGLPVERSSARDVRAIPLARGGLRAGA